MEACLLDAHHELLFAASLGKRPECSVRQDLDNFRKELRLMAAVDHPNVVSLLAAHVLPPGSSPACPIRPAMKECA